MWPCWTPSCRSWAGWRPTCSSAASSRCSWATTTSPPRPVGTFRTQDGYINIAANKQEQWEAVCDLLGVPELKTDPRFQERDTRKKNRKAAHAAAGGQAEGKGHRLLGGALNTNDVPSGAILRLEAALRQPQVRAP